VAKNIHPRPLSVKLGNTWTATGAWTSQGPIVLVKLESGTGDILKSRFDVHKAAFIDPVPETSGQGIPRLARSIAALSKPGSSGKRSRLAKATSPE
jgi:hypothetical protein